MGVEFILFLYLSEFDMKRRTFFKLGGSSCFALAANRSLANLPQAKRSVCIIGHTGRGNYGHGLDTVWLRSPKANIIGVADPDRNGLGNAISRLKLPKDRGFNDYRKMLSEMRPDVVAVCPRQPDQHFEMCSEAIKSGVKGIYIEKPFVRTPVEADTLKSLCKTSGVKMAVAHRNRYHPVIHLIKDFLDEGRFGKILEIRGRGKGDHRGGGEDLWVLGTHVLDLMAYFGGPVESCSARCFVKGRLANRNDVVKGNENLGLIIGDEIHARYWHSSGIASYFDSIANDETQNHGFGLNIIGSKGVIRIFCDRDPVAYFQEGNPLSVSPDNRSWKPIATNGIGMAEQNQGIINGVQNHDIPVDDLLTAIELNKAPVCSVNEGAQTVELVHAVFYSHIQDGREVMLPLKDRSNSLESYSSVDIKSR